MYSIELGTIQDLCGIELVTIQPLCGIELVTIQALYDHTTHVWY